MENFELAWLGGIWDGEGSIYMSKQIEEKRVQYKPTISMENTDPGIIVEAKRILEKMGIRCHIMEKMNKLSTKTIYRLSTSKLQHVKIFCDQLIPYLHSYKKHQATLILSYCDTRITKGKEKYDDEDIKNAEFIRSSQTTREAPAVSTAVMI